MDAWEPEVYFEASSLIIAFVCLGKWVEAKAKARTSDTVRRGALGHV